jgi:hypothetical protein
MNVEEMFKDMAKASVKGKGNYIKSDGQFLVRSKVLKTYEGRNGKRVIFGFEIVESNNAEHPAGSSADYTIGLDNNDYADSDIKKLIFALAMNLDPKLVKDPKVDIEPHEEAVALFKAAVDQSGKCAKELEVETTFLLGRLVKLETKKRPTKPTAQRPNGGEFTDHFWSPVKEQGAWSDAPSKAA